MADAHAGVRSRKDLELHQMTIKIPEATYAALQRLSERQGTTPTARVRALIDFDVDPPESVIIEEQPGDQELVLVERDGIQVRAKMLGGRVQADSVRIVDVRDSTEIVYWCSDEWKEGNDGEDPTTAMNAILSAIQAVAFGQYRRVHAGMAKAG
jgi:hypothetical protein